MAHELYIRNGKASMMYVGKIPWHGLGTQLDHPPTSAEAIQAAGLNWEVDKFPLFVRFGKDGQFFRQANRMALMPLDRINSPECPVLGVVGQEYGIVQNRDAFDFFDPIISEKKAFYETAGALGEGERVWILAKIPGSIIVHKNDTVDKYLLLVNTHTGMASVQIKLTPVRVVCNNTLTMALSFGESIKIPHFPDVKKRLTEAGKVLKNIFNNYEILEKNFVAMANSSLTPTQFTEYLDFVMPVPKLEPGASQVRVKQKERIQNQRKVCCDFFESGHENDPPEIKHTLWSAYNTITYFSDYVLSLSDKMDVSSLGDQWDTYEKEDLERRLKRIWFGDSAALKMKAYDAAVRFLKAA